MYLGPGVPREGQAALDGVVILDLSRVLSGPYCTAMLADLGARVIKIESPTGDDARHLGPFRNGVSVYFAILNRGKQSVALDLKREADVQLLRELVRHADVLVENFRPGVMDRLGLSYDTLRQSNPALIYASISGFGQTGPQAARPAYDLVIQAESGLMDQTGWPGGPPTRVGESLGDVQAGLLSAFAITAALYARTRDGMGTHLDISMLEGLLSMQVTGISQLNATGESPHRVGNRHPVSTPFDTYAASDGLVVIAVANESGFARLAGLIGHPELSADPRYATDEARTRHEPEVRALIEEWSGALSVAEVVRMATEVGVAASPIRNLQQALESPHLAHRRAVAQMHHPVVGDIRYVPQPVRMSGRSRSQATSSPELNADGERVREWVRASQSSADPPG